MRALGDRFIALVLALGLFAVSMTGSRAEPYTDALLHFTGDSFDQTIDGINAVAASGNPLAATVIAALQEGRLLFSAESKRVFIRDRFDQLVDAATGQAAAGAPPADLAPVRLNNRLRRIVEAALGSLTLMAPDPARRLEAAQAVFKSKDANALPALEQAIAKETDARVKQALIEARAAVVLYLDNASDADKIDAVAVIRQRGDQDALGLLGGLPASASPAVKKAAADAIASIQNSLAIWTAVQNTWYGLSLGSVLLLAAIGLAITFGVMGVINMAHGEMVMLGAYTTFVVQETIRHKALALYIPGTSLGVVIPLPFDISLDWSLPIAIPLAFLFAGFVGILIERGIIRFLYGRPLETLLATWGLSLILQQAVRTTFGPTNKDVSNPSWMSGSFDLGQITITYNRMWIIVFTLAIFMGLLALLRFTRFGLEMRAVTQNRAMAASMGIRTSRIDALTFGLGSGIAGLAGVALSQIDNVSPNLGQGYIIDSFLVVVFGGVGNLWGTLVGAFTLGIANKFLEPFAGAVLGKIAILVLIILFIQKRPRGLFALKGRAAEA
jgi:urea transport system permease protein